MLNFTNWSYFTLSIQNETNSLPENWSFASEKIKEILWTAHKKRKT